MANQQNLSRRAALRQQQELEQRQKRTNRIIGISAGILVVAILAVIAIVAIPPLLRNRGVEVTANQLTPPNATAEYGILYKGKAPVDGVPHVILYEDFRCPGCASREATYGAVYEKLADDGKITVEFRPTYFLDTHDNSDNSQRATIAALAADAAGKFSEYKKVLFQNQASSYTDKQLRETFAEEAGITGDALTKFQEEFRTRAYLDFAKKSDEGFTASGAGSTPTFRIGDRELVFANPETNEVYIQPTEESMLDAITKAYNEEDAPSNQPLGA